MTYTMSSTDPGTHKILQKLLKHHEITVAELARRINIPQPSIQRIVAGTYKNPRNTTLQPIADYFQVSINQLRGLDPISFLSAKKTSKSIPLLKANDILYWPNILQQPNQHIVCDNSFSDLAFSMLMPDTSMEPLINKGSILLIDPVRTPHHGSFIALKLQSFPEVVIRQLITDGIKKYIKALSSDLPNANLHLLTEYDKIAGVIVEIRFICESI